MRPARSGDASGRDGGEVSPPASYNPKHLAEKILTSKSALEGERKLVTVLFADLKGSMELLADHPRAHQGQSVLHRGSGAVARGGRSAGGRAGRLPAGDAGRHAAGAEHLVASIEGRALSPRILELRGRLAAAVGDAPSSDRTRREALNLYRTIGAAGHAERLARELDAACRTTITTPGLPATN